MMSFLYKKTVLLTSVAQISRKASLALNELSCPLRVVSGPSTSYQLSGRYRAHTGRSVPIFQKPEPERLLFPKADVQIAGISQFSGAVNGQKRPLKWQFRIVVNRAFSLLIYEFSWLSRFSRHELLISNVRRNEPSN
jgi:hypothetical protein